MRGEPLKGAGLLAGAVSSGRLRGLRPLTFSLETDQHSGSTGGVARNPIAELAQIASEIFDALTGRAKTPGFYDDVEKLTKSWTENFRKAGFTIDRFKRAYALKSIRTKDPFDDARVGRAPAPTDRTGSSACDALCSRAYNAQEQGRVITMTRPTDPRWTVQARSRKSVASHSQICNAVVTLIVSPPGDQPSRG